MAGDQIEAIAKATEESAKTTGKAIDAARDIGKAFSVIFGRPAEEIGYALGDRVRYWRLTNLAKLHQRLLQRLELTDPAELPDELRQHLDKLSPRFSLEFVEGASKADAEKLQDLYAGLLLAATSTSYAEDSLLTFVSILRDMRPYDAHILDRIYDRSIHVDERVKTLDLPDGNQPGFDSSQRPTAEVEVALWNLSKLSCIVSATDWDGGSSMTMVKLTLLGRLFVEACRSGNRQ